MGTPNQNAQAKVVAVIILSIVAAVMAYFRFFHKPAASAQPADSPLPEDVVTIPELPASLSVFSAQGLTPLPYSPPRRDIFAPPLPPPPPPESASASNYPNANDYVPVPVQEQFHLSGIMQSTRGPQAIINGRIVRTGDRIGEYTVTATGMREVVLTSATNRVVLTLGR